MSDWAHIEPPVPRLTPVQERIREMLRAGKTYREICRTLMIRSDHLRDEIFEIRKYEAIMGKGKNLTQEQKATIVDMYDAGIDRNEIAQQVGCSPKSVYAVAARAKEQRDEKKTAINKEFDDAVNEMIAEAKEPECTKSDTLDTKSDTKPDVPEEVLKAVQNKIDSLTMQIAVNCERIESITEQNDRMKERAETLAKWMKEVQA